MADSAARFASGVAALERDDVDGAERIFRGIVADDPNAHRAWSALSSLMQRAGRNDAAVEFARRAVDLERRNVEYLNALGVAYLQAGELSEAERTLRRALHLQPVFPKGLFNLGRVLERNARLADAQRAYERAYATGGRFPVLYVTLAQLYRRLGRLDLAIALLDEGLQGPDQPALIPAMADCIVETQGVERAIEWLRQAQLAHPTRADIKFKLGFFLLSAGQWREAWKYYSWRYLENDLELDAKSLPDSLEGERVQLVGEQGLGDVLFFLRFLPQLTARGAVVDLGCEAKLAALLKGDPRFNEIIAAAEAPQVTYRHRVSAGDLPGLLGADTCPPAFHLASDPARRERCAHRLAALGAPPYLGLTWKAGTDTVRIDTPSLSKQVPPAALGEALRGWKGTLVSLQRNPSEADISAISAAARAPVHNLAELNDDLCEILALLDVLDEYVTVSNTNVHLRAGLGRSARVLIPQPPEWRWMHRLGRSEWFPDFPVYREPVSRGWREPLAHLRADLLP
jgi:Tfp pilus assembly protein PilF